MAPRAKPILMFTCAVILVCSDVCVCVWSIFVQFLFICTAIENQLHYNSCEARRSLSARTVGWALGPEARLYPRAVFTYVTTRPIQNCITYSWFCSKRASSVRNSNCYISSRSGESHFVRNANCYISSCSKEFGGERSALRNDRRL